MVKKLRKVLAFLTNFRGGARPPWSPPPQYANVVHNCFLTIGNAKVLVIMSVLGRCIVPRYYIKYMFQKYICYVGSLI